MVFWEKTEAPGMGQFYRVYLGKYDSWEEALSYFNRLRKAGVSQHLGIHWFIEPETPERETLQPATRPPRTTVASNRSGQEYEKNRFIDNGNGTITDRKISLMWIKNGWRLHFLSAMQWYDAVIKLKKFNHGKFNDWRLPTIEEWNSLIDTTHQNPALVQPNPFVNIISHMPYWSQSEFTYGHDHTCNKQCPFESYIVMLYSGNINHQKKSNLAFVLPVRSID